MLQDQPVSVQAPRARDPRGATDAGAYRWWNAPQRILIAGPAAARMETLERVLSAAGYEVLYAGQDTQGPINVAASRKSAAEQLAGMPKSQRRSYETPLPLQAGLDEPAIDLLVIDLDWPGVAEWADRLLERFHPLPPIIGVTRRHGLSERAAALGVDFLLERPLNYGHVLTTIQTVLAQFAREGRLDECRLASYPTQAGSGRRSPAFSANYD